MNDAAPASPAGAVYDRGYRPYDGALGGRGASRMALARWSIRRALGLRRSWRQKLFPWGLLVITTIPAIVNVGAKYLTRDLPVGEADFGFISYYDYVGAPVALLLFVAITAPDIVCPDRRNRVLPLIFARPLTGTDYALTKVGTIAAIIFGFGVIPHIILFVGQMLVTNDGALDYARENAEVLWQVPLSLVFVATYYAAIAVALAATTTRRIVGAVAFLGVLLVTNAIAQIAREAGDGSTPWAFVDVLGIPFHLRDLVFLGHVNPRGPIGDVAGAGAIAVAVFVAEVGAALLYLVRRYRQVQL